MNKKKIDFEVNIAIEQFLAKARELGAEFDPEFIDEYRQTLEGVVMKELAERGEESGQFFPMVTYRC